MTKETFKQIYNFFKDDTVHFQIFNDALDSVIQSEIAKANKHYPYGKPFRIIQQCGSNDYFVCDKNGVRASDYYPHGNVWMQYICDALNAYNPE